MLIVTDLYSSLEG